MTFDSKIYLKIYLKTVSDPKFNVDRQRFTVSDSQGKKVALSDDKKTLKSYGLQDGCK